MMWWTPTDWGWGWGVPMIVGMLLFWSLVVWAILGAVRAFGRPQKPTRAPETTLAERFASGEIDLEDYRTRLAALRGRSHETST